MGCAELTTVTRRRAAPRCTEPASTQAMEIGVRLNNCQWTPILPTCANTHALQTHVKPGYVSAMRAPSIAKHEVLAVAHAIVHVYTVLEIT
eukprot:6208390-Pleurochrysis_carterae.AAC.5